MTNGVNVDLGEIHKNVEVAHSRIGKHIHRTSLIRSHQLSELIKGEVYFKCENEQYTGSFKARGSLNKMLSLTDEERNRGIVTASTGNHALGFARSLQIAGAKGTVYLPAKASEAKVKALSYYPVELVRHKGNSLDTEIHAKKMALKYGKTWMSPYNDSMVIAGQGTIGYEICEDLSKVDYLLATVGGGGLISGIGAYIKKQSPSTIVIGCQPENSPEMTLSIEAGHIVDLPEFIETLSDGSAGGIEPNAVTFDICREVIDDSILTSEEEIKEGIWHVVKNHKKIIEGAAGVAVASLLKEPERFEGSTVVVVLCGANIAIPKLLSILNEKM